MRSAPAEVYSAWLRCCSSILRPRRGSPAAHICGVIFQPRWRRSPKSSTRWRARVAGERLAPADLWSKLCERFALIGVQGVVRMAMAGFDVAAWDALAIAAGWPLATLLGSAPKRIPAYNSCGLGLMAPQRLADEAEKLLAGGFRAVKLRLGYPTLKDDLVALHAVKRRLGSEIAVMVDYNQALSLAQALERGRALDREGVYWLEEPIRHDDYAGNATLVRELETPIQVR